MNRRSFVMGVFPDSGWGKRQFNSSPQNCSIGTVRAWFVGFLKILLRCLHGIQAGHIKKGSHNVLFFVNCGNLFQAPTSVRQFPVNMVGLVLMNIWAINVHVKMDILGLYVKQVSFFSACMYLPFTDKKKDLYLFCLLSREAFGR